MPRSKRALAIAAALGFAGVAFARPAPEPQEDSQKAGSANGSYLLGDWRITVGGGPVHTFVADLDDGGDVSITRLGGDVSIEGQPEPEPGKAPEVFFEQVSRGYFDTLGLRLIAGRPFETTDAFGKTPVVIINETMARRFWPNQSALGKRIY